MIVMRALMLLGGASLVATGLGMTMIGVLAFIGVPLLVLALGLVSAAATPRRSLAGRHGAAVGPVPGAGGQPPAAVHQTCSCAPSWST